MRAEELELQGDFDSAKTLYITLLSKKGPQIGMVYFEFARFLFRQRNYEEALSMLINAYEKKYCQDEILSIIDEAYYLPNVKKFKKNFKDNMNALKMKVGDIGRVDFDELKFKLIPCSEHKYYIFSLENKQFLGLFDENEGLGNFVLESTFPFIMNIYSSAVLKKLIEIKNSECIWLVYENIENFLPFLQIFSMEVIKEHRVKFIFTVSDFVWNWEKHGRKDFVETGDLEGNIVEFLKFKNKINDKECQEKIKEIYYYGKSVRNEEKKEIVPWRKGKKDVLLSFCIPTYNRGAKAKNCVEKILQYKSDEIEVIISDNNSPDSDGKYQELSEIGDSRLLYYRNNENVGFAKNWYKVMEKASGKFVFILSDEDFINIEILPDFLGKLRNANNVAAIRSSMKPFNIKSTNAAQLNVGEYRRGYDALFNCSFSFNYISGSIYNRDFIVRNKLFELLYKEIEQHAVYPHLYLEALLCTVGKYLVLPDLLVLEGEAAESVENAMDIDNKAYSYESRLSQHSLFTEAMEKAYKRLDRNDLKEKAKLYLRLCFKLAFLVINVNGPYYIKQGRNIEILIENAYYHCLFTAGGAFKDIRIKQQLEKEICAFFNSLLRK